MCNPQAQAYHSSTRIDDPELDSGGRLLRHCRTPAQIVPRKVNGLIVGQKVSDQAFKAKKGDVGVSVDLECLLLQDRKTWQDRYGKMPNTYAMLAVTTGEARFYSRGVAYTPKPFEGNLDGFAAEANPYHGEVILPMSNAEVRNLFALAHVVKSDV